MRVIESTNSCDDCRHRDRVECIKTGSYIGDVASNKVAANCPLPKWPSLTEPKYSAHIVCPNCDGYGEVGGEQDGEICPKCKGKNVIKKPISGVSHE